MGRTKHTTDETIIAEAVWREQARQAIQQSIVEQRIEDMRMLQSRGLTLRELGEIFDKTGEWCRKQILLEAGDGHT